VHESNGEIKIDSIFCDDVKQHLWCNPSKNAFHCWKTDNHGNLFELVSKVSGHHEAVSLFSNDNNLRKLEEKLDKFFSSKTIEPKVQKVELSFPPFTYLIKDVINVTHRQQAENYLKSRKLDSDHLMFCISGKYKDRIIIPYYNKESTLVYWNSRDISGKSNARYLGPDSEVGVGKGDVIYMQDWSNDKIYLTEGEFDAMSLTKCGITGAACGGKSLSNKQLDILKGYKVCVCFDTDKSGEEALNKIGDKLVQNGVRDVSYVRPPVDPNDPSKKMDWNRMLIDFGSNVVKGYIDEKEKRFTYWTSNILRFNNR
jgi:hypothetical protein